MKNNRLSIIATLVTFLASQLAAANVRADDTVTLKQALSGVALYPASYLDQGSSSETGPKTIVVSRINPIRYGNATLASGKAIVDSNFLDLIGSSFGHQGANNKSTSSGGNKAHTEAAWACSSTFPDPTSSPARTISLALSANIQAFRTCSEALHVEMSTEEMGYDADADPQTLTNAERQIDEQLALHVSGTSNGARVGAFDAGTESLVTEGAVATATRLEKALKGFPLYSSDSEAPIADTDSATFLNLITIAERDPSSAVNAKDAAELKTIQSYVTSDQASLDKAFAAGKSTYRRINAATIEDNYFAGVHVACSGSAFTAYHFQVTYTATDLDAAAKSQSTIPPSTNPSSTTASKPPSNSARKTSNSTNPPTPTASSTPKATTQPASPSSTAPPATAPPGAAAGRARLPSQ